MKHIVLIGFLIFTYSCGVKSDLNSEVPKELFQRWKLDYGIINGQKVNGLAQSPNNDYEFKQNGEYLLYNGEGSFMTGTWKYNSKENVIYTTRHDGELNGKIMNITTNSIIIIPSGKAIEETPLKNLQLYYIPKRKE